MEYCLLSSAQNTSQTNITIEVYNECTFKNHLVLSFVYILVLLMIGIPGNILVCYIYGTKQKHHDRNRRSSLHKHYKWKSFDIFITAIASFDLLSCTIAMPIELAILRNFLMFDHTWLCKLSRYVSFFNTVSTSFVLLCLAIDRYRGIRLNKHWTTSVAIRIVIVSVVIGFLLALPIPILYGTFTRNLPSATEQAKICLIENRYFESPFPLILAIFLFSCHVLFDIIFCLLYGLIGKKIIIHERKFSTILRENNSFSSENDKTVQPYEEDFDLVQVQKTEEGEEIIQYRNTTNNHENISDTPDVKPKFIRRPVSSRSKSTSNSGRRRGSSTRGSVHGRTYNVKRTSIMMLVVTVVFLVTFFPYCVIALIRSLNDSYFYDRLSDAKKSAFHFFLRSYFLSSSINPILYNFFDRSFRTRCKTIIKDITNVLFFRQKK